MPLGSLTESTIKEGFEILNKIDAAIKNKENSILSGLSDEFYWKIPHDFGFQKMSNFILKSDEQV